MTTFMREYPKIHTIYQRDERGVIQTDAYATPEIAYLANCNAPFSWTEKIDGTNVRVGLGIALDGSVVVEYGGRNADSQMPTFLFERLRAIFEHPEMTKALWEKFTDMGETHPAAITLYGEGYGNKIQKAGRDYIPDGVDFILFDILIGRWWLRREDVEDIASYLGLKVVPVVGEGSIAQAAIEAERGEFIKSEWPHAKAEGYVGKPLVDLFDRADNRIMVKIKRKDFDRLRREEQRAG